MPFVVKDWMLVAGGLTGLLLLVFQVLQGLRKIRFKGPLHLKVHKAVGFVILAVSAVHATAAVIYLFF